MLDVTKREDLQGIYNEKKNPTRKDGYGRRGLGNVYDKREGPCSKIINRMEHRGREFAVCKPLS